MLKKLKQYLYGNCIAAGINIITLPFILRMIEPRYYGIYSIFMIFYSFFGTIISLGLEHSLLRYYFEGNEKNKISLTRKICETILKIELSLLVLYLFFKTTIENVLIQYNFELKIQYLMIVGIFFLILNRIVMTQIKAEKKARLFSKLLVLSQILNIILVFFVYYILEKKKYNLIISIVVSNIIVTFLGIIAQRKFWKQVVFSNIKEEVSISRLFKYSVPLLLSSILILGYQSIDKLMLEKYELLKEIGIYSVAIKFANILNLFQQSFNSIWIPSAIEYYKAGKKEKISKINSLFTFIICEIICCLLILSPLMKLFISKEYEIVIKIFPFLMIVPMIGILSEIVGVGIILMENTKYQTTSSLITLILNIILNSFFINKYKLMGVIISTMVCYIIYYLFKFYYSKKVCDISFKFYKSFFSIIIIVVYLCINFYLINYFQKICVFLFVTLIIFPIIYKRDLILLYKILMLKRRK